MTAQEHADLLNEIWYELTSFLNEVIENQKKAELMPVDGIILGMRGLTFVNDLLTVMLDVPNDDLDAVSAMFIETRVAVNKV